MRKKDLTSNSGTDVPAMIAALSGPVRTTFLAAASRMLGGLVAYPAAWTRRYSQEVEDITDARTAATRGLVKAALVEWKNDPTTMQAAAEIFLPDAIRKVRNKSRIAAEAAEELARDPPESPSDPDNDWMNGFIRHSEDASFERLQKLFGKVLAGEISKKGTFSLAALRVVSELSTDLANDFAEMQKRRIGDWILRQTEFSRGQPWERLVRLQDSGLLSSVPASTHQPESPLHLWAFADERAQLILKLKGRLGLEVPIVNLTRLGLELSKLLPPPDTGANLRALADWFPKTGVEVMFLSIASGHEEVLHLSDEVALELAGSKMAPREVLARILTK